MTIGFHAILSWIPGVISSHAHLAEGGVGCAAGMITLWIAQRNCRSQSSVSNVNPNVDIVEDSRDPARYSPPPDPMRFTENSEYATALASWNESEMHRINLLRNFRIFVIKMLIFAKIADFLQNFLIFLKI